MPDPTIEVPPEVSRTWWHVNPFSGPAARRPPRTPIHAVGWRPEKPPPLVGRLQPNDALRAADVLAAGQVKGPEDVVRRQGWLYFSSFGDGRILRLRADATPTDRPETFAVTGGAPVDLAFAADGRPANAAASPPAPPAARRPAGARACRVADGAMPGQLVVG
jgi:hypothetical protein